MGPTLSVGVLDRVRRAMKRFGATALVLFLLFTGCASDEPAADLITSGETLADLLELGIYDGPPGLRKELRPRLEIDTTWPDGAFVSLHGRITQNRENVTQGVDDGADVEIPFRLEVDGEVVAEQLQRADDRGSRFQLHHTLPSSDGRTRTLSLTIGNPDDTRQRGVWQRATLDIAHVRPRLEAGHGRNILFVVVDTLRADFVGTRIADANGELHATTPNLDRFAAEARVFQQAVSTSSWTMPATASLLIGTYPHEHGMIDGGLLRHHNVTLGERLQNAGFSTVAISANPLIGVEDGFNQGFERFEHLPWARADEVGSRALSEIEKLRDYRWMAYVHYMDPHSPYDAPGPLGTHFVDPAYGGPFADPRAVEELFLTVNFGKPAAFAYDQRDLLHLRRAYAGEVRFWDHHFGTLLDQLDARGLLDNTIVVVTADHGEEFAEHGHFQHGHHLYDETIRVPLMLWAPDRVEAGNVEHQVESRRIGRTLLQLSGLLDGPPRPDDLLMTGDPTLPAFAITRHQPSPNVPRRPELRTIRRQDRKLIWWRHDERLELYDLRDDPGEQINLVDPSVSDLRRDDLPEEADDLPELKALLELWDADDDDTLSEELPVDPELIERLRALGYVQ